MFHSRSRRIRAGLTCAVLAAAPLSAQEGLSDMYRETAGRILGAAMTDQEAWTKLTHLTTRIGNRLSGSPQLEQAIAWAVATMREEGLEGVTEVPAKVPHWVRGRESLHLVTPLERPLQMLGLGGSVATPEGGVTAPILVVRSFDALEAQGRDAVAGKVVVYAVDWEGYGRTVQYRSRGASRAAALGAVAALVRSATGNSLYTPHTGALRYEDGVARIPSAAITVEDADWFRRMSEAGQEVTVRLEMAARTLPDADSANVVAEIRGRELPDEVVVMGGHFDSWDVGQGAHDDGAACIAAWQALRILQQLGLRPRRTLRIVLFTNEENGLAGGQAYRAWVGDAVSRHVAAIEMDGGAERPVGFGLSLSGASDTDPRSERARQRMGAIGELLAGIEAGEITAGGGGADIGPLMAAGVPGLALRTTGEHYFDWHHTNADTLDKVDPQNLRKAVAMLAVAGYVLADMPERLLDEPTSPSSAARR